MIIFKILFYPINVVFRFFIMIYKFCISPLLPHTCIYYPSCSSYSLQAIKKFGIVKGMAFSVQRILKCTPKNKGGFDPVKPNIKGDDKWLF